MQKKIYVIISIIALCLMTGCSKTPELSYAGEEILYSCTKEQVNLFKEDVNVNINEKQGFIFIDNNFERKEYTNGLLEFTEENRPDVSKCYFISYEEITGNKFESRTAISHRDPVEGGMRISVSGNYSFKVKDSKTFIDNYTTLEQLNNYINTNINSVYILSMPSKTYTELASETEFDETKLKSVNSLVSKYGIEVTNVNIETVQKVS